MNASPRASRIWYFDLLRILASVAVICLHVYSPDAQGYGPDSLHFTVYTLITTPLRWAVPIFLMISGALFLSPERQLTPSQLYRKTISRVVVSFLVWSLFYALVHCLKTGKGVWTLLNQLLRGHYHMWYLFLILGLYLLTPVLRKLIESRKTTEYLLALLFVFVFLLSRLLDFIGMLDFPHLDVVSSLHGAVAQANPLPGRYALFYYLLGHYLHTHKPRALLRRSAYALGIAGYLLTAGLTLWHSRMLGSTSDHFIDAASMLVLFMSVALFLFFGHAFAAFQPSLRAKRVLSALSVCTYGVYLVHPFFIEILVPAVPSEALLLPFTLPAWAAAIYALSFAASFLLMKLPIVNRYLL